MLAKIDGLHTNTSRRDNRKTYYNALIGNNNSNKFEFLEIKFKKKRRAHLNGYMIADLIRIIYYCGISQYT